MRDFKTVEEVREWFKNAECEAEVHSALEFLLAENQKLWSYIDENSVETLEKGLEPYYEELAKLHNEE